MMHFIVIDDDIHFNVLSKLILQRMFLGVDVQVFSNPIKAINYILSFRAFKVPCIIMLDIEMPEMNGWDVLSQIDELRIHTGFNAKVVMISSTIDSDEIRKANTDKRVAGFIQKPLTQVKLIQVVQPLLK